MNSRERVLQAFNFVQPDRVPVDFGGHRSSGIMAIAYVKLREYLGLPRRPVRVYDIPQQLAVLDEDILDRFNVDTIEMGRGFSLKESDWRPWVLPDGTDCFLPRWVEPVRENGNWVIYHPDGKTPVALMKPGMLYFEQTCWPMAEKPEEKLDRVPEMWTYNMWAALASPPGPVSYEELAAGAKRLRERTSRAILGLFGGNFFEGGQMTFRMDNFYMLLASDPALAHRFLDKMLEMHLKSLEPWLKAVAPYIDIVLFGDDLGMQTGPQISPRMYREFFKPRHKALWGRAKELAPHLKVMLHSCGSLTALMPDLIDAGMDTANPVQITSKDMEPERLKAQFGRQHVFWGGGCDTQQVLRAGTPRAIRDHVWHNLDIWAPGGGYVFQQVHNIMADIPPQNIVAMFDAVAEWNAAHA
jgi:uroporphyrinogen decarboxylase